MKRQTAAVWMAVGIGAGVAIGTATHAMPEWTCIGAVVGAAMGVILGKFGKTVR